MRLEMIADPNRFPTWGHPQSEWEAAKNEARNVMIEIAQRRSTIAYSDLAAAVRTISFQADEKPFHNLLGQISIQENEAGRGMLSVLVVHRGGNLRPGPGFFELAHDLGRTIVSRDDFWAEEMRRVQDAWPR